MLGRARARFASTISTIFRENSGGYTLQLQDTKKANEYLET